MTKFLSFNFIIDRLNLFWRQHGCVLLQPFDSEVGAGTFHSSTFINALINDNCRAVYTQFSRRPFDIKSNRFSNKSPIFHQYQVILKPSIYNIQSLYIMSLKKIGIKTCLNDLKFIEDNWKSPSLAASGIGWEVRLNGVEITQFTYFQQMGGLECTPVMVEIAYGLERLALHIQNISDINDIIFDINGSNIVRYGDIFKTYEQEYSRYLSEGFNLKELECDFNKIELKINMLLKQSLPFIAYDYLVKLAHIFNLIDSQVCYGFLRQTYMSKTRALAIKIAKKIKNE